MPDCKKTYNLIDIAKFFCALLVVGIHAEPFSAYPTVDAVFGLITRIAVPFFFAASGFFFFKKEQSFKNLLLFVRRILILYAFWSAAYLIYDLFSSPYGAAHALKNFIYRFPVGTYEHLWFLYALIVSTVIVFLLVKLIKNNGVVFAVVLLLLLFGLSLSTYFRLFSGIKIFRYIYASRFFYFVGARNGLFYAPIYTFIGYYFSRHGQEGKKPLSPIIFSLLSFALLAAEAVFCTRIIKSGTTILWLSVVPLTFFVFSALLRCDGKISKSFVFLRKTSILVYLIHRMLVSVLEVYIANRLLLFFVVCALSLILAYGIYRLSKMRGFGFLKYIF